MDKYHQIVEAAIKVFAREGLEKGKIADIAKEAGIGKGTVYEYFRSKDEIFKAIEKNFFAYFQSIFQTLKTEPLKPSEKLEKFINSGLDLFIEMGDAMLILTELWAQASRGHWHSGDTSIFVDAYSFYRTEINSILNEGIKMGELREMNKNGIATLLLAFIDGMAWQYMVLKDPEEFQKVKTEAVESFMRGIRK